MNIQPLELHQSSLDDISCPRKFYYKHRLGLTHATTPDYFAIGEMYHAALALWSTPTNSHIKPDIRIHCIQWRIQREFTHFDSEWIMKTFYLMNKSIKHDLQYPLTVQSVEETLTAPTPYPHIIMGGTIDGYIRDEYNKLWILERKTESSPDSRSIRRYRNSIQIIVYYYLMLQNLDHLHLTDIKDMGGTMYEICPKAKNKEMMRFDAIVSPVQFQRGMTYLRDMWDDLDERMRNENWPRYLHACYGKFLTECALMSYCYLDDDLTGRHCTHLIPGAFQIIPPHEQLAQRGQSPEWYTITPEEIQRGENQ